MCSSYSRRAMLCLFCSDSNAIPIFSEVRLDGRLKDAHNAISDLKSRLGTCQQELKGARNQASQYQQTISLLVTEKNALVASANIKAHVVNPIPERTVPATPATSNRIHIQSSSKAGPQPLRAGSSTALLACWSSQWADPRTRERGATRLLHPTTGPDQPHGVGRDHRKILHQTQG